MSTVSLTGLHLENPLGVGTVGTVYRARESSSGNEMAVKLLSQAASHDPLIIARFQREMVILEKLSHPNIVRYFGGGQNGKQLFYCMELVTGGSVKQVQQRLGRIPWQLVVYWGRQICSALQHAHNHGIIHRDLKPGNLFLGGNGVLKLGDFGIARDTQASDLTANGLTVGTYAYMSPEQIRGSRDVTEKTDLYALGCVLYEMLTGRPPFPGENFAQIFDQHLNSKPPRMRDLGVDCPASLESLILEMLQKDPDARPFNARAVQGRLTQVFYQEAERRGVAVEEFEKQARQLAEENGGIDPGDPLADNDLGISPHAIWFVLASVAALVGGVMLAMWAK